LKESQKSIGVFDSGLGGLTVLRAIHEALPDESTVYLGDTARVPYGIRSNETVLKYSLECAGFLKSKRIKLLVVACNTASSISLPKLRRTLDMPVVGVIEPGARAAVKASAGGRIAVIGTEATIQSGAYQKAISSLDPAARVEGRACPLFVPLAEEGWTDDAISELVAKRYLSDLRGTIKALVLGCTHYPLLAGVIGRVLPDVSLIDSARETAMEVREILAREQTVLEPGPRPAGRKYYVTDRPRKFSELIERFLGHAVDDLSKIEI